MVGVLRIWLVPLEHHVAAGLQGSGACSRREDTYDICLARAFSISKAFLQSLQVLNPKHPLNPKTKSGGLAFDPWPLASCILFVGRVPCGAT